MLTLILDTATTQLNIGVLQNNHLIIEYSQEANKQQSEITMSQLQELFESNNLSPLDIDQVVITKGPGSYTGIRIAMTIAKVIAAFKPAKLYTLNTLQCYVGKKSGLAIMDARANRAYFAIYDQGEELISPQVDTLDKINYQGNYIYGDAYLLNKQSQPINLIQNIIELQEQWELVDDVDALVPYYLKESDSYGVSH